MNGINDFPKEMIFDKKIDEEKIELIRRQYKKVLSIGKMNMDSISYQLFLNRNNEIYLPKDALVYSSDSDDNLLLNISEKGILGSEFFGIENINEIYYSSYFYKIQNDILLSNYKKLLLNECDTVFSGNNDKIAFIVNPTSKIGGLLYYDIIDSKFDNNPMIKDILDYDKRIYLREKDNRVAAILVGVPANAISGIILGDKLLLDHDKIENIKKMFPNSYIISKDGLLIRDRSNVIRVEDFEDISYKYAKEKVENDILCTENNKLKNDIKNILNSIKKNTSFFEQALIYKSLGYKIPSGLYYKLSESEIEKLK